MECSSENVQIAKVQSSARDQHPDTITSQINVQHKLDLEKTNAPDSLAKEIDFSGFFRRQEGLTSFSLRLRWRGNLAVLTAGLGLLTCVFALFFPEEAQRVLQIYQDIGRR